MDLFLFILMLAQGSSHAVLLYHMPVQHVKKNAPLKTADYTEPSKCHYFFPLSLAYGNLLTILLEQIVHSDCIFREKLRVIFVN